MNTQAPVGANALEPEPPFAAAPGARLDVRQLLDALRVMRRGDFSVRLPTGRTGVDGAIASAFNDVVAANQRLAQQLEQVGQALAREGRTSNRVRIGLSGAWADVEQSVNTLIGDASWPTSIQTADSDRGSGDQDQIFAELHRKTRELERLNAELELRVSERTLALERSRAALEALNHELEARIEQRTREREDALAQLFEAQKIDTIGQLTGGVAHDFNNLLMAMLGSLEMLKKRIADDPRAHRLLDNAIKGAERGAALTQRLLAFARRQELRPEAISVAELIASMNDLLNRSLGPTIAIAQQTPDYLAPVMADANQLELALLNLALNARDAMPEGGVLTIAAEEEVISTDTVIDLKPGHYIRLSVSDTGCGMDARTLARAAEPFFTTKGTGKGTGLGLSMVHGLAAQLGGALRIQSSPGDGSRVDLILPRAEQRTAPVRQSALPARAGRTARATILLVDDDVLVSTGTAAMLEDLGHEVVEAGDGAEALDLLESHTDIDMVITDQAMPGMTGIELARQIRERFPKLPIVLASGYAELPQATADGLVLPRLSKPFMQQDLAAVIARHCRPRRIQAAKKP